MVPLDSLVDLGIYFAECGDVVSADEIEAVLLSVDAVGFGKKSLSAFRQDEVALGVEAGKDCCEHFPVVRGYEHLQVEEGFQQLRRGHVTVCIENVKNGY